MSIVFVNKMSGTDERPFNPPLNSQLTAPNPNVKPTNIPTDKPAGFDVWLYFEPEKLWVAFKSKTEFMNNAKITEVLQGVGYPGDAITFSGDTVSSDQGAFPDAKPVKTSNLTFASSEVTIFLLSDEVINF